MLRNVGAYPIPEFVRPMIFHIYIKAVHSPAVMKLLLI